MSKYRKGDSGSNPFASGGSPEEADNAIFSGGMASELVDQRVVARPTPIMNVWADVRQPRRAVPASIRADWNGAPEEVPALLRQWHVVACEAAGIEIDAIEIINGRGEGVNAENAPAIFESYLSLLRLAADIKQVGLSNPISVIEQAGHMLIESGERRWLAYHLLATYAGDEWAKIPVIKTDGRDFVWRQASENTARRSLNAIGMARQLALLIMAAREGLDGVHYDEYEALVLPGGCDRRFYAQVANGNVHRIPKGMGERIQASMGLSMAQLSQYRRLLQLTDDEQINDALWVKGDVEDWAEMAFREVSTLTTVKVREVIERPVWGLEELRNLTPSPPAPSYQDPSPDEPAFVFQARDVVRTNMGHVGIVISTNGALVMVKAGNEPTRAYKPSMLTLVERPGAASDPSPQPSLSGRGGEDAAFENGEAVQVLHTGEIGEVIMVYSESLKVMIDGEDHRYHFSEVTSMGMTFEALVQQEIAGGDVTFDGDEDEPASDNPYQIGDRVGVNGMKATGTIRYLKGDRCGINWDHSGTTHYYDWREMYWLDGAPDSPPVVQGMPVDRRLPTSDKPLSGGSEIGADNSQYQGSTDDRVLLDSESQLYAMMGHLIAIAEIYNDEETADVLAELMGMRMGEAVNLAKNGKLHTVLATQYAHIQNVIFEMWMKVELGGHLDQVQVVASE